MCFIQEINMFLYKYLIRQIFSSFTSISSVRKLRKKITEIFFFSYLVKFTETDSRASINCNKSAWKWLHIVKLGYSISNFSCMFLNPNNCFNLNSNWSNLIDLRNLQEQVKKAFCYQQLFWPFTVWINCTSDLKIFTNSSAFSLKFQKVFSITRTIFSQVRTILVTKYHTVQW